MPTPLRLALALGLALLAALAVPEAAAEAGQHSLALGLQADARQQQELLGTLTLPLGSRQWLRLAGGSARRTGEAGPQRAGVLGLAAGHEGEGWRAALALDHRRDGDRLRQTRLAAGLEWVGEGGTLGLQALHRNGQERGLLAVDGAAAVPVRQQVRGPGIGLHGSLALGAATRLHAGLERHDLRRRTEQEGSDGSLLAQALSPSASWVARDEAALARSLRLGASHRFEALVLGADYLRDHALDGPGPLHTVQLRADLALAPGWTIAPTLGRSRSEAQGGVNFGGVSLIRAW